MRTAIFVLWIALAGLFVFGRDVHADWVFSIAVFGIITLFGIIWHAIYIKRLKGSFTSEMVVACGGALMVIGLGAYNPYPETWFEIYSEVMGHTGLMIVGLGVLLPYILAYTKSLRYRHHRAKK